MNRSLNEVSTICPIGRFFFFFAIFLSEMLSHDYIIAVLIVIQLFFGGTVFVYAAGRAIKPPGIYRRGAAQINHQAMKNASFQEAGL